MHEGANAVAVDDSLLEAAARCLDDASVRALAGLQLGEPAKSRLDLLAGKANEGELTPDEAAEYERFIELSDFLATLRLKAEKPSWPVGAR